MECTASEDEEVPDSVAERKSAPDIENNPNAVWKSSGKEEDQADLRHVQDDAFEGKDEHPPHNQVNGDHQFTEPVEVNASDDNAGDGHSPDYAKHDPTHRSP